MELTPTDLRVMIAKHRLVQADVAARMGVHYSTVSRVLNEHEPMPEGFAAAFVEAVNFLAANHPAFARAGARGAAGEIVAAEDREPALAGGAK